MLKPDATNHLTSHFGTFLGDSYRIKEYTFKEHGDGLHPRKSLCHPTNLCYTYMSACC